MSLGSRKMGPISGTWGFLVWPSSLKKSDWTSLRIRLAALLSASFFVSFIYFLYSTQREHSVPAPGTHCSVSLRWLAYVLLKNYSKKPRGGREWKEKKKISLECLSKLLGISSHISLCSLRPPLTQISQRLRHQPWGLSFTPARSRGALDEAMGMEGIPVCPGWSRQPGEGQHPPVSSELTLG